MLNNSSSCIDFFFKSQPNLEMESRVHSQLHSNCLHQIIYARFDLKIYYPPAYEREIWHYKKANIDIMQLAIREFDWKRPFTNGLFPLVMYFRILFPTKPYL